MSKLKITAGLLKGRNIAISKDGNARYTSGKVREAVFNMIGEVKGCNVLDLYAGSGSFTIEAISRGAQSATCVEKDRKMASIIKENFACLSIDKDCLVLNMDVRYAIPFLYKRICNYDIIFMDPPYEKGLIQETMLLLKNNVVYDRNTVLITEFSKRELIDPAVSDVWQETITRQYGDTCISIFRIDDNAFKS